jgi:hypothetical protein
MNTPILFKRLLLAGLSTLAVVCSAETAAPSSPLVSARLKFLSLQEPVNNVALVLENGKQLPVAAASGYISKTFDYAGPAHASFVKISTAGSGEEKPPVATNGKESAKPEVLASMDIPETGGDFLVLLSRGSSGTLYVMVVPFSPVDVPAGTCLVWNITSRNIGFSLGGQRALLSSGQRQLIHPAGSLKNYFDLKIFDEYEGRARALMSGDHYLNETSRQVLLIAEKIPGQAPVMVRTIEELPEKPKQTQVAMASSR